MFVRFLLQLVLLWLIIYVINYFLLVRLRSDLRHRTCFVSRLALPCHQTAVPTATPCPRLPHFSLPHWTLHHFVQSAVPSHWRPVDRRVESLVHARHRHCIAHRHRRLRRASLSAYQISARSATTAGHRQSNDIHGKLS